jgi:predicted nucleic acid-binding protein
MAKRFVIDNSVVMAWCFAETSSGYARDVLNLLTDHHALAPAVWPLEAANFLLVAERRRRIPHAHALRFLQLLGSLPITVDPEPAGAVFDQIFALARTTGLSSYDASYLWLAVRESVPLATLDDALRKAARQCGVKILQP